MAKKKLRSQSKSARTANNKKRSGAKASGRSLSAPSSSSLTQKQQRFAAEYLIDLNATQAAIRAGYSETSAHVQGARLINNAKVAAAIRQGMNSRSERTQITQDEVLAELALIARADMGSFMQFRDDGQVFLDWSNLPRDATKLIREITQEEFIDGSGDDARMVRRTKFRLHDKINALKLVGTHLGMFVQAHKHKFEDKHVKRIVLDMEDGDDEA